MPQCLHRRFWFPRSAMLLLRFQFFPERSSQYFSDECLRQRGSEFDGCGCFVRCDLLFAEFGDVFSCYFSFESWLENYVCPDRLASVLIWNSEHCCFTN